MSASARPLLLAAVLLAPLPARAGKPQLAHALSLYDNFDLAGAERELDALLAASPPPHTAAIAHIYLGLIDMELRYDSATATVEFRKAVAKEPTVDVPYGASPKERMIFLRAQAAEFESVPKLSHPARSRPAAEPKAVAPPPARSRTGSWVAFGVGAGALAAGAVFGVLDEQVRSEGQNAATRGVSASTLKGLPAQASTDAIVADVCYGAAAAAGIVGVALLFTGARSATTVAAVPVAGGAVATLSGRF
ncbi:MAG: hypothetical protein ACYDCL_23210 [Myxococcales bacterium]